MASDHIDAIADQILPLDGPHTPDAVILAAAVIAELVRRLNHATLSHNAPDALPAPQVADGLLGGLDVATGRLPQLFWQVGRRLGSFDPDRLGVDDLGPIWTPSVGVASANADLDRAAGHMAAVSDSLACARGATRRFTYKDDS